MRHLVGKLQLFILPQLGGVGCGGGGGGVLKKFSIVSRQMVLLHRSFITEAHDVTKPPAAHVMSCAKLYSHILRVVHYVCNY